MSMPRCIYIISAFFVPNHKLHSLCTDWLQQNFPRKCGKYTKYIRDSPGKSIYINMESLRPCMYKRPRVASISIFRFPSLKERLFLDIGNELWHSNYKKCPVQRPIGPCVKRTLNLERLSENAISSEVQGEQSPRRVIFRVSLSQFCKSAVCGEHILPGVAFVYIQRETRGARDPQKINEEWEKVNSDAKTYSYRENSFVLAAWTNAGRVGTPMAICDCICTAA